MTKRIVQKLAALAGVFVCALPACALADGADPMPYAADGAAFADSRIKLLRYSDVDVYTINTKYGYQTSIVFGDREDIQTISVGDRSMWQIIPSAHRLFIRPMEDNVITNMTVLTNKHSYQFDLKSIGGDKKNSGTNIYVAKFLYPEDTLRHPPFPGPGFPGAMPSGIPVSSVNGMGAGSEAHPVAPPAMPQAHAGQFNYNYTYTGPDELAPLQVYDDGHSTTIRYRNAYQPLPDVYIVEAGGAQRLMPYHMSNGAMVVDAVAGEMKLKNSDGAVSIYNETLNPKPQ